MKKTMIQIMMAILLLQTSISAYAQQDVFVNSNERSLAELAAELRTRPLSELSNSELQLLVYEREILRRFMEEDLDETMDLFLAENAMVFPPNMGYVAGRDNQKALFKPLLSIEGLVLDWEPIDAKVSPSDEMGYAYGLVRWKIPGEPQYLGKYISVWIKEGGKWMNQMEIRNTIKAEE